jgi:ABC-type uncharacterized transport system involved in gliding motility auxiliary subunit
MFKKLKKLNIQKKFKLEKFQKPAVIVVTIVILIAVNVVISAVALRLDLSKGRAYTLSSPTKKILKNLKDTATLTFYASSDIPTKLLPLKSEVVDLMNEYKKQSNKVKVNVVDPKKDAKAEQQATNAGVPELQFSQLEQDKYNVTASMFGIVINYGSKTEVIPQATDTGSLEYSITAALYRLTQKELPKVAIIGDDNSFNPQADQIATFRTVLPQQVQIEDVDISTQSAQILDSSYKTAVVLDNNQKKYTSDEIKKLNNYIAKKGTVIVLADGVWVPGDLNGNAQPANHNLFGFLQSYGLTLNRNILLSDSYELLNFGNGVVSFESPYPYWIKAAVLPSQEGNFSNISHLTFPWASSVTLGKKKDFRVDAVVDSSNGTWEQTKDFTLFPQDIKEPNKKDLKTFTLIAESINKNGGGVVVIPTSRFADEDFVRRQNDNLEFMLNLVGNMASNGALSGIRHREVDFYALPAFSDSQKNTFKFATILLLPLLFALYGAWRVVRRK